MFAGVMQGSNNSQFPANMYIWDPYGQNLGIYPIPVLHGSHIGFCCPYKTQITIKIKSNMWDPEIKLT